MIGRSIGLMVAGVLFASPVRAQFLLEEFIQNLGIDDVEITPDGTLAVARENTFVGRAHIFDVATGVLITSVDSASAGGNPTAVEDGVALTNDRAVVLGTNVLVLDLTNLANPLLADVFVGFGPRDVVITPDESLAVVRGGALPQGGIYVIELATGTVLANTQGGPSDPFSPSFTATVDSVVTSNTHAVGTSFVQQGATPPESGRRTRVTVMDLAPAAGGVPVVAFETDMSNDLLGAPHDLAISPDGTRAAVRSDLTVAYFDLNGGQSTLLWSLPPWMDPGPFVSSALDSIVMTDDRIATISRLSNGGIGAQVDIFDAQGNQWFDIVDGDPHDLELTNDGNRVVVRTSAGVLLYDLANLPATMDLVPLANVPFVSTHTSFGAGLDSVSVTEDRVVALARDSFQTRVGIFDLSATDLTLARELVLSEPPVDVDVTPDGTRAVISGTTAAMVVDLRAYEQTAEYDLVSGANFWPWADGVAVNDSHAFAFGVNVPNTSSGWLAAFDLFSDPAPFCTANANSTGESAEIFASGSARVGENDLNLWVSGLPENVPGFFRIGNGQGMSALGDGFECLTGAMTYYPMVFSNDVGVATRTVDNSSLPQGAAFAVGSTWNFQFLYRDTTPGEFNLSDGLSITFEN